MSKKALMILAARIHLLPWSPFFFNGLRKNGYTIDVITWNRDGVPDKELQDVNRYEYCYKMDNSIPKSKKLSGFIGFKKYCEKKIKQGNYDIIISSTAQSTLLFYRLLTHQYNKRYIYDMRDPSYEKKPVLGWLIKNIVTHSKCTFISSEGYRNLIPSNGNVYVTHNYNSENEALYNAVPAQEKKGDTIRISFWGFARDFDVNMRFIELLANDKRFSIDFYGMLTEAANRIFSKCKELGIANVRYRGTFTAQERFIIARNTDLILNLYSNAVDRHNPRMTNKYYDCIQFRIPQIVMADSFMGDLVRENGLGFITDLNEKTADQLYDFYHSLDRNRFYQNCEKEIKRVDAEQREATKALDAVLR